MAKPSRRILQDLLRLKPTSSIGGLSRIFSANRSSCTPSIQIPLRSYSSSLFPSGLSNSTNLTSEIRSKLCFHEIFSKLKPPNVVFPHLASPNHNCHSQLVGISVRNYSSRFFPSASPSSMPLSPEIDSKLQTFYSRNLGFRKLNGNSLGSRYLSSKSTNFNKINGNFTKTIVDKPLKAVRSAFARYREAVGLQIEAFWKRNYLVVVGALGVGLCVVLWRVMFGIANTFIGLSEGMAKYGFLALSTAIVAFSMVLPSVRRKLDFRVTMHGLYFRSRYTINPDRIYRMAMRNLNTSAGILEVMGAPLSGTDLRAYVMSGGGLSLKNFKPRLRGKRCFLIFPIRGSERKGLVSVEVKKKKGQYDMKLLAVDIPMMTGPDQRLFLIGDEGEYKVGGGLISELRDPIVKAMAAEKEFEDLDQMEEEEDAERELQEAERKHRVEIEKLEKGSQQ
ncbi:hypothetical protein HHK36_018732 [Tetracentron sinense]|uniref:Import inner membrane translocase subunit n=1 Tax=Tetracentron sinense TaxID=13715 RepID=A0A834YY46_TETSI|nr:hypothetical protein HHK36_018732 [Tetracentron sinense]